MTDEQGANDDIRDLLVEKALAHVPFEGWSAVALAAAAEDAGMPAAVAAEAFPEGGVDAAAHFVDLINRRMERAAEQNADRLAPMRPLERLAWLIRHRLEPWSGDKEAIRRSVALLALPCHAVLAAHLAWASSDALWRAAGDRAQDLDFYAKRMALSAVAGSTLFFWLNDESENEADSWAFLARRLEDMNRLTNLRRGLAAWMPVRPAAGKKRGRHRFGIRE